MDNVAIVGGGIGGLTAALALMRRGIDVDVYEQAPELRELGAGVQISANGTRVLSCARPQGGAGEGPGAAGRQGDPAVEHRAELEAVRPRPGIGRALRLSLHHHPSRRSARRDRASGAAGKARRHSSEPQMRWAHAIRRPRRTALRNRRDRSPRSSSSAPTACIRWCAKPCSARRSRISAASSPGAASSRWSACRPRSRAPSAPIGSAPAATSCIIRCAPESCSTSSAWASAIGPSKAGTCAARRKKCCDDFRGWHADVHALIRNIDVPYKWGLALRPPMDSVERGPLHAPRRRLPPDGAVAGARRRDGARRRFCAGARRRKISGRS